VLTSSGHAAWRFAYHYGIITAVEVWMSREELLDLLLSSGVSEAEVRGWLRGRSVSLSHRSHSAAATDTVTVDDIDALQIGELPQEEPEAYSEGSVLSAYSNLGIIGHGATSVIHRVGDRDLKRTMAAKVLRPELMLSPDAWARFVEEAQITAQLQHPGIVPVHELGRLEDGRHYFTMKEIEGRTMREVIREVHEVSSGGRWSTSRSGWSFRRLVSAFHKACDAVAYAHERMVIHRDLKPQNIMMGPHGEVLVVDWGLAKVLPGTEDLGSRIKKVQIDRSSEAVSNGDIGQVAGTPAYMAPEQARGATAEIDERSDVYGLGACLYTILVGSAPFTGETVQEVIEKVLAGPPPSPDYQHRVGTALDGTASPAPPRQLVEICVRAMARDRNQRYADAGELSAAVLAWLEGAQRRAEALSMVTRARELLPSVESLRRDSDAMLEQASALLERMDPWAREEEKASAWMLEESAEELRGQASLGSLEVEQLLLGALAYDPNLAQSHEALAQHYRKIHEAFEFGGNARSTRRLEALLRTHAAALPVTHERRADHFAYLKGDGRLTLVTNPAGAKVELYRFKSHNMRMVPEFVRELGPTPFYDEPLAMGSYLLKLSAAGHDEVSYPVFVQRQHHWDGVRPGADKAFPIWLPPVGTVADELCYVPAGWFISGGDDEAIEPLPRRRLWVDGYLISRFPVTNRQYLGFLNALLAAGEEKTALSHVPTERTSEAESRGKPLYGRNSDGLFALGIESESHLWRLDDPVVQVDERDAMAYAAWLAKDTRRPVRLASELEWEKAGRGVDGRGYPWGDKFDASWCCVLNSHQDRPRPALVDSYPVDVSVYGVRGMAGNVRDWCAGEFQATGPVPLDVSPIADLRDSSLTEPVTRSGVQRGGGWITRSNSARCASRFIGIPGVRHGGTGFRVMIRLPDAEPD
jgi:eukaryotic-like serine/threonine-protein kinase